MYETGTWASDIVGKTVKGEACCWHTYPGLALAFGLWPPSVSLQVVHRAAPCDTDREDGELTPRGGESPDPASPAVDRFGGNACSLSVFPDYRVARPRLIAIIVHGVISVLAWKRACSESDCVV